MANKKTEIENTVRSLAQPLADGFGLDIWDVKYVKEGTEYYLRIEIDKPQGVTIDDCEKLSRAIDPVLDEKDPISDSYCLEVSSPGLGRTLCRAEHFERFTGSEIRLRAYKPVDGKKEFVGTLEKYDGGAVTVSVEGKSLVFAPSEISSVRLNDDADI